VVSEVVVVALIAAGVSAGMADFLCACWWRACEAGSKSASEPPPSVQPGLIVCDGGEYVRPGAVIEYRAPRPSRVDVAVIVTVIREDYNPAILQRLIDDGLPVHQVERARRTLDDFAESLAGLVARTHRPPDLGVMNR
jgi:hypothetical protein